ncbi:hypothetical protein EJ07DRAFT_97597, partial [Lizonia empirigonia]
MSLEAALREIDRLKPGEKICYTDIAKKYGVVRSTLTRRHKAITTPITNMSGRESTLVEYINRLTHRRLPPTRQMVQNSAAQLAQTRISERWVSRFLHRQKDHLLVKWQDAMDRTRHRADSGAKYKRYFDQLHSK